MIVAWNEPLPVLNVPLTVVHVTRSVVYSSVTVSFGELRNATVMLVFVPLKNAAEMTSSISKNERYGTRIRMHSDGACVSRSGCGIEQRIGERRVSCVVRIGRRVNHVGTRDDDRITGARRTALTESWSVWLLPSVPMRLSFASRVASGMLNEVAAFGRVA